MSVPLVIVPVTLRWNWPVKSFPASVSVDVSLAVRVSA